MKLVIASAAIAIFSMVGCVSTSTYKKAQKQNEALQKDRQTAETRIAALQEEVNALKQANEGLSQEKDSLAESQSEYQGLVDQLQQEVQQGQLKVTQYQNMLTVDVAEKIFFDSGRARLKEGGKKVLAKVAEALKAMTDKSIYVVGHTDNVPLSKSFQNVFPTNWELSVLRATNVVRFLQETGGIEPDRLIASGRGEFDPVADNATPEGRRQNRRIEIMILDKNFFSAMKKPQQQKSQ